MNTTTELEATGKQIAFLASLAGQKLSADDAAKVNADALAGRWGRKSISEEINRLKGMPRRQPDPRHPSYQRSATAEANERATESLPTPQAPPPLVAGMYRMGEDVYKVQVAVHGSGLPYAKLLAQTGDCRECGWTQESHESDHEFKAAWRFEYAPGAIKVLFPEHRMTLDEAKAFGALYGTCCVCGRTLTNEVSIEAGIGPICGGRV